MKERVGLMTTEQQAHDSLHGKRILIVEDLGLITLELKRMAEDVGCVIAATAARLDEARSLADTVPLDGVLLDLNLAGERSYPVAEVLRQRGVPFIFLTGYDSEQIHPDFAEAPHLHKPFGTEALEKAMRDTFVVACDPND